MKFFNKGFTLIELLVTIGVLAVVAAGVVALLDPRDKILQGGDSKVLSDIGQISTAAQAFAAQNGRYPSGPGVAGPPATELRSELQNIPTAPNGFVAYALTYDAAAPVGETFVAVGEIRSNRFKTSAEAAADGCTAAATCFWRFESGNTCYRTTAIATCP